MSPRQAAKVLEVSHQTVRNRIKAGKIKARKVVMPHGQTVYDIPDSELRRVKR
jgi:excisionase family DNA binding protein